MPERELRLGEVVCSRAGRDRGQRYVVVEVIGDRFVAVADGWKRKVARPKKKNVRHLVPCQVADENLARKLAAGSPVDDAEIRALLRGLETNTEKGG